MSTDAEKKAERDGFYYSGVWCRKWEKEELAEKQNQLKAEGYKTRQVSRSGGTAIYIKDTPKTLAAQAAEAAEMEKKRLRKVGELSLLLRRIASETETYSFNKLREIELQVTRVLERDW